MIYGLSPLTLVAIGSTGPAASASVTIRDRLSGSTVTVYADESGSATLSQPLTSTAVGAVNGYLPLGRYAATFSGAGITTYVENFDIVVAVPYLSTPIWFGAGGSGAPDTSLYRGAVNTLGTGGNFTATGNIYTQGQTAIFGNAGPSSQLGISLNSDTYLYRSLAGQLKTDGDFVAGGSAYFVYGGAPQISLGSLGLPGAAIAFGSSQDANLYRLAANRLKTDGRFDAAGLVTATPAQIGAWSGSSVYAMFGNTRALNADAINNYAILAGPDQSDDLSTYINAVAGGNINFRLGNIGPSPGNTVFALAGTFAQFGVPITAYAGWPALSVQGIIQATPGIRFSDGTVQTSAAAPAVLPSDIAYIDKNQTFTGLNSFATPIYFGSPFDGANLYRFNTNVLKTDADFRVQRTITSNLGGNAGAPLSTYYMAWGGAWDSYRHAIQTTHSTSVSADNVMDFVIWQTSQANGADPTGRALRVDGNLQTTAFGQFIATPITAIAPTNTSSSGKPYAPAITTQGVIQATPGIVFSSAGTADTFLYRSGVRVLATDQQFRISNVAGDSTALSVGGTGNVQVDAPGIAGGRLNLDSNGRLNLPQMGSLAGIVFGAAVNLYYATPTILQTDAAFAATPIIAIAPSNTPSSGKPSGPALNVTGILNLATPAFIQFSTDTNLYRSAASVLKTDSQFWSGSQIIAGQGTAQQVNLGGGISGPAITSLGLISATPGIRFPDGSIQIAGELLIDARNYGVVGDGVTDNALPLDRLTKAIQAKGGGTAILPRGTVMTSTPLVYRCNGTYIKGHGREGTILQKNGNFDLILMYGVTGSVNNGASKLRYLGLSDMTISGGSNTGRLVDCVYTSEMIFRDLYLKQNNGVGLDFVEVWDSLVDTVILEDINSTTEPSFWIRSSRAASGFGSSTSDSDEIKISNFRTESWKFGGLRIEGGTGAVLNPNFIFISKIKAESAVLRGEPIHVDNTSNNVHIKDFMVSMNSFDTGFSTAQYGVYFAPSQGGSLRDGIVANQSAATTLDGINCWTGATIEFENIKGQYTTAPTSGFHLNLPGGGPYTVNNVTTGTAGVTAVNWASNVAVWGAGALPILATPLVAVAPSNTPSTLKPYGPAITSLGLITATPGIRFADGTIFTTSSLSASNLPTDTQYIDKAQTISAVNTYSTPQIGTYVAGPWLSGGLISATPGIVFPDGSTFTSSGIRGTVSSAGVIVQGIGFSLGTGAYGTGVKYINLAAAPLYATPVIDVTPWSPGVANYGQTVFSGPSRNGFFVQTANGAGTATPFGFSFTAII